MIRTSCLRTLVVALSTVSATAQELLWERAGVADVSHFGGRVEAIGDIDGDRWSDLMHIVRFNTRPTCWPESQLWILSGKDGSTLRTRPEIGLQRTYRTCARAGDMDGDGHPDYATMIWDQSNQANDCLVEVRRARDDRLLWQASAPWGTLFGFALLSDLDLDGDKRPDLVATVPRGGTHGEVRAYSSKGGLLYRIVGTQQLALGIWEGDWTLGKVGDADGDGADDFVVGGIRQTTSGFGGSAVLISGRTGKVLHVGAGVTPGDSIGHSVAGVGDVDGDGVPDFAGGTSKNGGGLVMVFSGRTGNAIHTWRGRYPGSNWGWSIAGSGIDIDRDGVPDVIAGAPITGEFNPRPASAAYLISGRDGQVMQALRPLTGAQTYLGMHVAMIPAQPGSPFPLFAVTEPDFGNANCLSYLGKLMVFRGSPPGVSTHGIPCAGSLSTAPVAGVRDLGARGARFTMYDGAPSSPALLMIGLSDTSLGNIPLPIPLSPWGLRGCLLRTSVDVALWTRTDAAGFVHLDLPLPLSGAGRVTLHSQWLSVGAGTAAPGGVSDAVAWKTR